MVLLGYREGDGGLTPKCLVLIHFVRKGDGGFTQKLSRFGRCFLLRRLMMDLHKSFLVLVLLLRRLMMDLLRTLFALVSLAAEDDGQHKSFPVLVGASLLRWLIMDLHRSFLVLIHFVGRVMVDAKVSRFGLVLFAAKNNNKFTKKFLVASN